MSKTKKSSNSILATLCLTLLMGFGFTSNVSAKQCIMNKASVLLDVTWYNSAGKKDKNSSNHSLSQGFKACQDNKHIGFAVIKCKSCDTSIVKAKNKGKMLYTGGVATGSLYKVDIHQTRRNGAEEDIINVIKSIPSKFDHKFIVVLKKGKTVSCTGPLGDVGCPNMDAGDREKLY